MFRTLFLILVVLVVAIGGGAGSVWVALSASEGVGAVNVGAWTAFPDVGTPEADTYSKARFAREGGLSLGRAEGIAFSAQRDSAGDPLRRECAYMIEGAIPSARFWTLYAADARRIVLPPTIRRVPALHSLEMLRTIDGAIRVAIGGRPTPGNWLGITGSGPMQLVLTLYDTPTTTAARAVEIELPQVLKVGCDA
jgi:hypothetical protein